METPNRPPLRKLLRLSLRAVLVLVLAIGAGLGWIVRRAHVQREAVAAIERIGGKAWYDWEWSNDNPNPTGKPWWPRWLVDRLGVDYFGHVAAVFARPASDAELAPIGDLDGLECLILGNSAVTDNRLAHLEGLTQLQILNLQNTGVTDAGLRHLKGLTNLRVLGLGGTSVSDAGIVHLKGLTHLTDLGLEGTRITETAVRALQGSLPKTKIRRR